MSKRKSNRVNSLFRKAIQEARKSKARDFYPEQDVFEKAVQQIKWTFGLDLSLVEKEALRKYVGPVLDGLDAMYPTMKALGEPRFYHPVGEAITRFMMDYYELPLEYAIIHTTCSCGNVDLYIKDPEAFKEYLGIVQEKSHMP